MPVLAIDTSAAVGVALVAGDGALLAVESVPGARQHAERLAPAIRSVLSTAGVAPSDLTGLAVGTGPAPFTGLRVGLVTAQSLALVTGLDVWGVPVLDVLAQQAAEDLALSAGDELVVTSDARRREVYWARYRVPQGVTPTGPELVAGPGVASPGTLVAEGVTRGARVVGAGVLLHPELLGDAPDPGVGPGVAGDPAGGGAQGRGPDGVWSAVPDAAVLARLAIARSAAGWGQPAQPLYLRRPDAQEPGAPKRATG